MKIGIDIDDTTFLTVKSMLKYADIFEQEYDLLNSDNSGHGFDHIDRVLKLSLDFAEKEKANKEVVTLIALLHDVDDYKLFGAEHAKNLTNAKSIMNKANVPGYFISLVRRRKCSRMDGVFK